jgi:carbonic anhydrase/acetyltransferase-like protein (isoleucine patch superfamily)
MAYVRKTTDRDVLIAEGAAVVGDVTLGKGVSVWYNATIRGDQGPITVGEDTNIQECAVIHQTSAIGKGCTIGHGAIVHGCTIGDNTLVGMGAIVLTGAVVGRDCLIGAGAMVTGKMVIPDGSLVLGSPAKVVRSLTPAEIQGNVASKEEYLDMARWYREAGH